MEREANMGYKASSPKAGAVLCCGLILLLGASAWGQEKPPTIYVNKQGVALVKGLDFSDRLKGEISINGSPCDDIVTFHGHSKKVREIFPLECLDAGSSSAPSPQKDSAAEVLKTFHHCTFAGSSSNFPHLFDTSEIYKCNEGTIEFAGRRTLTIEYGYVYEEEMGKPACERPHIASKTDYEDYKWCPTPQRWDPNQKEMCGDKPTKCFDGKMATWDPEWQGYSCATPGHK